jgi:hypothetical protein
VEKERGRRRRRRRREQEAASASGELERRQWCVSGASRPSRQNDALEGENWFY